MNIDNLEEDLRRALRRVEAPSGFGANVLARTKSRRRPAVFALAAGLAIGAMVPAGLYEHRRAEEARGLDAGRKLFVALAVTRMQLQQTKEKIQRATRHTL